MLSVYFMHLIFGSVMIFGLFTCLDELGKGDRALSGFLAGSDTYRIAIACCWRALYGVLRALIGGSSCLTSWQRSLSINERLSTALATETHVKELILLDRALYRDWHARLPVANRVSAVIFRCLSVYV